MNQPPGGGGGYPPQGGGHPPQGGGYPPQGGGYPPQGGGYPPQQGQYPGGSYLPPPGHMPGPHGVPPKRSAIPRVIGILMIVFAGLGLLVSLIALGNESVNPATVDGDMRDKFETLKSYESLDELIGLLFSVFHLVAGIQLVRYHRSGPKLAIAYAIAKIVYTVIGFVLVYAWLMPALDGAPSGVKSAFGVFFVFAGLISMAWPIIVWALVSRPQAKAACQ